MPLKIVLTSRSELKYNTVKQFLESNLYRDFELYCVSPEGTGNLPVQPIDNDTTRCCLERIECVKKLKAARLPDLYISVENGIDTKVCVDIAYVAIQKRDGQTFMGCSENKQVRFDPRYIERVKELTNESYFKEKGGYAVSIGELLHKENPEIPSDNWMKYYGVDRCGQIEEALKNAFLLYMNHEVQSNICYVQDFPKPGVIFKHLTKIMADSTLYQYFCKCSLESVRPMTYQFNKILALESRGFILGSVLAYALGKGLVLVRKKGKTPGQKFSVCYETEYSKDEFEIAQGVLNSEDKVLLVDDLVATGGSLKASKDLVEQSSAQVVGCCVALHVAFLYKGALDTVGVPIKVVFNC